MGCCLYISGRLGLVYGFQCWFLRSFAMESVLVVRKRLVGECRQRVESMSDEEVCRSLGYVYPGVDRLEDGCRASLCLQWCVSAEELVLFDRLWQEMEVCRGQLESLFVGQFEQLLCLERVCRVGGVGLCEEYVRKRSLLEG